MNCNATALPSIEFVGGETQNLSFNIYTDSIANPSSLSKAAFSITPSTNKFGSPILSKNMSVSGNTISVQLTTQDTINLSGKYIYQIVIKDSRGLIEIPDHGVLYIKNNIDKSVTSGL